MGFQQPTAQLAILETTLHEMEASYDVDARRAR